MLNIHKYLSIKYTYKNCEKCNFIPMHEGMCVKKCYFNISFMLQYSINVFQVLSIFIDFKKRF